MLENDDGAGQIIAKPHKHVSFPKDENFKDEIVTWPSSSSTAALQRAAGPSAA